MPGMREEEADMTRRLSFKQTAKFKATCCAPQPLYLHLLQRAEAHLLPCISPSIAGCPLPECASSDTSGLPGAGPWVPGTTARTKPAVERRGMRGVNGKGDTKGTIYSAWWWYTEQTLDGKGQV